MSWRNELHEFYLNRVSGGRYKTHASHDILPMGYWNRMVVTEMQHFEKMMHDYRHDRQTFIAWMISIGIDPLLMSDILDWQDTLDEMRKTLLSDR